MWRCLLHVLFRRIMRDFVPVIVVELQQCHYHRAADYHATSFDHEQQLELVRQLFLSILGCGIQLSILSWRLYDGV